MKNVVLILCLVLIPWHFNAQEKSISGIVTTADDGLPLPGASVIIKWTSKGTQTDFDGKYTLTVNLGDIITVSYVGMNSAEIIIGSSNTYYVALELDNSLD